ncbi:MAG: NAD(P)/FAD-dependent oxidoreductase [Christensenellales bacterium]
MDIIVIGGGASGLMCATTCSGNSNCHVTLLEKNEKLGKKLYITGKGRCNVTNLCDVETFLQNVVVGGKFLHSAINSFPPQSTVDFFEKNGTPLKVERGRRVFPNSDKASDITKTFEKLLKKRRVDVVYNCDVSRVEKQNSKFILHTSKGKFESDLLVVATGGKSYPTTGSNGNGYAFAKMFGHNIIEPKPALVPLLLKDYNGSLAGLTLKNIKATIIPKDRKNGKGKNLEHFGEMLFTHQGVSGPIILTLSSFANKIDLTSAILRLDLKPMVDQNELALRLSGDISANPKKAIKNLLKDYLPQNFILEFLKKVNISENVRSCDISKNDRINIIHTFKNFDYEIKGLDCIDVAIVTSGGVDTKEVNPKTMESKLVPGLYFVGETLDVDALTGGYNIQIALATGYVAGKSCITKLENIL